MRYQVKWGDDVLVVEAANEKDAWSKFCHANDRATRHPRDYKREIASVQPADTSQVVRRTVAK
jgi:hypothetical protein